MYAASENQSQPDTGGDLASRTQDITRRNNVKEDSAAVDQQLAEPKPEQLATDQTANSESVSQINDEVVDEDCDGSNSTDECEDDYAGSDTYTAPGQPMNRQPHSRSSQPRDPRHNLNVDALGKPHIAEGSINTPGSRTAGAAGISRTQHQMFARRSSWEDVETTSFSGQHHQYSSLPTDLSQELSRHCSRREQADVSNRQVNSLTSNLDNFEPRKSK